MKRILIAAVMLGLAGGAYAADFGELGGVKTAGIKALAAANGLAVPEVNKGYVEPVESDTPREDQMGARAGVKVGGSLTELRIQDCYSGPHNIMRIVGASQFYSILVPEAGRAFLECQVNKDPQLSKKNPQQSSGEIIMILGNALGKDLPEFAMIFDQVLR